MSLILLTTLTTYMSPHLKLTYDNNRDTISFISASKVIRRYVAAKGKMIMDFALLNGSGLSVITLSGRTMLLWNASDGSSHTISNQFTLQVLGSKNNLTPVFLKRQSDGTWILQIWTGHLNKFRPLGKSSDLRHILGRAWGWPNKLVDSNLLNDSAALGLCNPFIRDVWITGGAIIGKLSWLNGKAIWNNQVAFDFGRDARLATISGNSSVGTVSVVCNENPRLRTWTNHRDYWTDHDMQPAQVEKYRTIVINMNSGTVLGEYDNVARIEFVKSLQN